jgi:hypothetical protein
MQAGLARLADLGLPGRGSFVRDRWPAELQVRTLAVTVPNRAGAFPGYSL